MGRRDRERKARILLGEESPRAVQAREAVARLGVTTIQAYSTSNQVKFLHDSLHAGKLSAKQLRKVLADKAPGEMSKGARKLAKKNKPVTVDALMGEYRGDKAFQELATEVGLDEDWFVALAATECEKWDGKS